MKKVIRTRKFTSLLLAAMLAGVSHVSSARADDGTQTQLTPEQMSKVQADLPKPPAYDPTKEGLDTTLTPSQHDQVRDWMGSTKVRLNSLLQTVEMEPLAQAKKDLMEQITDIVGKSDPKATETMMRYTLNRGMDIVKQIDADHLTDVTRPGVLDQEVRILKRSILFSFDYYQNDLQYLNSIDTGLDDLISPPRAQFGVRCAQFMMKLNRSLVASRAQYKIAFDTLGRLSVDLFNDDHKSDYGDAMDKIYTFQQAHKGLPSTSPEAIKGLREIEEEMQLVLQSLRLTRLASVTVSDLDGSVQ